MSHEPPILEADQSNRADVLSTVAAMVMGRDCVVLNVEVRITERCSDGVEQLVVVSGPVTSGTQPVRLRTA